MTSDASVASTANVRVSEGSTDQLNTDEILWHHNVIGNQTTTENKSLILLSKDIELLAARTNNPVLWLAPTNFPPFKISNPGEGVNRWIRGAV